MWIYISFVVFVLVFLGDIDINVSCNVYVKYCIYYLVCKKK